ncbi:MAG: hypothetical protein ABL962_15655 [Fimbriimonadaceae bacterium]
MELLPLTKLIGTTNRLRTSLEKLIRVYGEADARRSSDMQIWARLLTNDWRLLANDGTNRRDQSYEAAVKWLHSYHNYVVRLRVHFACVDEAPDAFSRLPLNGNQRASAKQLVKLLKLQGEVLAARPLRLGPSPTKINPPDPQDILRDELKRVVKTKGSKAVAVECRVDRDTLGDFLAGRTSPRKITLQRLSDYINRGKQALSKH